MALGQMLGEVAVFAMVLVPVWAIIMPWALQVRRIGKPLSAGLVIVLLFCKSAYAEVTVEVSSVYSAVYYTNTVHLKPGAQEIVETQQTPLKGAKILSAIDRIKNFA